MWRECHPLVEDTEVSSLTLHDVVLLLKLNQSFHAYGSLFSLLVFK